MWLLRTSWTTPKTPSASKLSMKRHLVECEACPSRTKAKTALDRLPSLGNRVIPSRTNKKAKIKEQSAFVYHTDRNSDSDTDTHLPLSKARQLGIRFLGAVEGSPAAGAVVRSQRQRDAIAHKKGNASQLNKHPPQGNAGHEHPQPGEAIARKWKVGLSRMRTT